MAGRIPRIALLLVALTLTAACGGAVSDEYEIEDKPYTLEPVEGQDVLRVILDEKAVERLGIRTAQVEAVGQQRLTVPYDAVYLDAHGDVWVYTTPEPFVHVRAPIELVRETSTEANLVDGPAEGTEVVTVGVPELYGSETEFDG
jgi:hypothetical protein